MRHLFFVHLKYQIVDILILKRPLFFLFKSEKKKTDDGGLKQMRAGLRNIVFYLALPLY